MAWETELDPKTPVIPVVYRTPRKNVLLIGCIDLRFADNASKFMDRENLTNRYDQFILAGAALGGLLEEPSMKDDLLPDSVGNNTGWKNVLLNHVDIAIALHKIEDVYIMEHEDCGAYKEFLKGGDYSHDTDTTREHKEHRKYSKMLADMIRAHVSKYHAGYKLHVHGFIMDLKGDVTCLGTLPS